MSMQTGPASQDELISFMERLADFHETLTPPQQAILDEMTATALGGDDVRGFAFSPVPSLNNLFANPHMLPSTRPFYARVASFLQ